MRTLAARLPLAFDYKTRQAEIAALAPADWVEHGGSDGWIVVPLRSRGGSARDGSSGADGTLPFEDTPLLEKLPYTRQAIRAIPCEVRTARLSGLLPMSRIGAHSDTADVTERLHVPVCTHPDTGLWIEEQRCRWLAGELWWGDFTRTHRADNPTPILRVHLVLCIVMNDWLRNAIGASTERILKE